MSNDTCNVNGIVNGWVESTCTLIKPHVYTYMCNYTDEVWIGHPDSQRTVDVEGDSCVDNTGSSTVVLSVRHTTVGVQSVRHITGLTYRACDTSRDRRTQRRTERATHHGQRTERATHHGVDIRETSGREQRRERDVSMENVVRDNYVKGLWISCDLNALAASRAYEINQVVDFMRRTRQLIAYRRDLFYWTFPST